MKKKIIALFLALTLVLSATACSAQSTSDTSTPPKDIPTEQTDSTNEPSNNQTEETSIEQTEDTAEPDAFEVLEADVMKDVENSISALQNEMDTLVAEIATFDQYVENTDFDDKYDDLDELYDELLDDAYDNAPFEKWFDARSNEYEFWLDLRGAAFGRDSEEAAEIIADFKDDIEKLKSDIPE